MQLARWIQRALILVAVPRFSYLRTNTSSRRAITASLDNNFLRLTSTFSFCSFLCLRQAEHCRWRTFLDGARRPKIRQCLKLNSRIAECGPLTANCYCPTPTLPLSIISFATWLSAPLCAPRSSLRIGAARSDRHSSLVPAVLRFQHQSFAFRAIYPVAASIALAWWLAPVR